MACSKYVGTTITSQAIFCKRVNFGGDTLRFAGRLTSARRGMPPEVVKSRTVGANASGPSRTCAVIQWVLAKDKTCMATHFRLNLACLRAGQSLRAVNGSDARQGDRNQAMWVIESRPMRRFRVRHAVQFADTRYDALRITARHTIAGNRMPSKVASSGRIGEHAKSRLSIPRRSSMDRTGAS